MDNGPETEQEKLRESFCKAAEPLMRWLAENVHPHHTVIVTEASAELVEGVVAHRTMRFVKD